MPQGKNTKPIFCSPPRSVVVCTRREIKKNQRFLNDDSKFGREFGDERQTERGGGEYSRAPRREDGGMLSLALSLSFQTFFFRLSFFFSFLGAASGERGAAGFFLKHNSPIYTFVREKRKKNNDSR